MAFDRPSVPPESAVVPDPSLTDDDRMDKSLPEDRTALLIIRAWMEEGSSEPLRVQIRLTADVSKGFQRTMNLSDVEGTCAAVQGWLMEVVAGTASPQ